MPSRPTMAKHWCFTINNPTEEDEAQLSTFVKGTSYLIVAKEVGESGTPHLQCYAILHDKQRITSLKKLLPRAHFEIARGTPQQASDYCKKDGDFCETGVLSLTAAEASKKKWDDIKEQAKKGELDNIEASEFVRHYHALKRIAQDYQKPPPDADGVTGVWYWGPPGVGKSRTAREVYPGAYLKPCNKWWDGYQRQPYVILDDFDKSHVALGHHLKIWADRYAFPAEHKGTTVQIRPEKFIVTSNYSIEDLFGEDEVLTAAIKRRFHVIHMDNPYNLKINE